MRVYNLHYSKFYHKSLVTILFFFRINIQVKLLSQKGFINNAQRKLLSNFLRSFKQAFPQYGASPAYVLILHP